MGLSRPIFGIVSLRRYLEKFSRVIECLWWVSLRLTVHPPSFVNYA